MTKYKTSKLPYNAIFLIAIAFTLFLSGCRDNWDSYYKTDDENIEKTILQGIENDPALSKFNEYLKISGYDKQLASPLSYSVWAQTNDIISDIEPGDTASISNYVGYCISVGNYNDTEQSRIKMLNGKYALLDNTNNTIENASFSGTPQVYQNGLLYITTEKFSPKKNIWEIFTEDAPASVQKQFVETLYGYIFDEENSKIIGVDQETGLSVYDSVKIYTNKILIDVADLEDEEKLYTFIILSDDAYNSTVAAYKTYYKPLDSTSVDYMAAYNTCIDLVIPGKIETADLPAATITETGIEMSLQPDNIADFELASNGIIYYVNTNPIALTSKFKEMVVEGEDIESAKTLTWKIVQAEGASGGYELYYEAEKGTWAQYQFDIPYPARYQFSISAVAPDTLSPYNQYIELHQKGADDKSVPFAAFDKALTAADYSQKIPMGEYTFQEEQTIAIRIYSDGDVTPVPPITLDRIIITPTNE
ncbi:MAG: hypothetical protein JW723_06865 [Bacteroidales bacterium]|nr:hypothetical protein [Bacteroidales bacterium]